MRVPYLDLRVSNPELKRKLAIRFSKILDHGRIIEGPEVLEFEERIASEIGARYAVGMGSGSSALFLALKALGVGAGDEVITTPFTWIITPNAIAATGVHPVFVDIKDDLNIDPDEIRRHVTRKTKAIVPVHVGGHICDMQTITQLASKYGLSVVEDAAQAFCSSFRGRRAGSFSVVAAFSMNPMKILHGYGESGVVTTNDHQIFRNLTKLRHAGTRKDPIGVHINRCDNVSLNHKIDTIQAAFLLENLEHLTEVWNRRDRIARLYDRELEGVVGVPKIADGETHGRYLYVIHCRKRNDLRKYLAKQEIESKVVYSPLACDAEPYRDVKRLEVPVSRRLLRKTLSIPLHEKMSFAQAKYVAKKIKEFYGVC